MQLQDQEGTTAKHYKMTYIPQTIISVGIAVVCLLALVQPDGATKALIGWAVAQPVLYAQLGNVALVAESHIVLSSVWRLHGDLRARSAVGLFSTTMAIATTSSRA